MSSLRGPIVLLAAGALLTPVLARATVHGIAPSATLATANDGSIALSPDGAHAYVGFTVLQNGVPLLTSVEAYDRDPVSGALTLIGGTITPPGGSDLVVRPDGGVVVGADGSVSGDRVVSLVRDPGTGMLALAAEHVFAGYFNPAALAISADSQHLYVAGESSDGLAIIDVSSAGGALVPIAELHQGVDGVDGLNHPSDVALSPDGTSVYVMGRLFGVGQVGVFARDAGTGLLTGVEVQRDGEGGVVDLELPKSVAVSPDGAHVYVSCFDSDAILVFARDSGTGALTFLTSVGGPPVARGLAFGSDPEVLFVLGETYLSVWGRDPATGMLTLEQARDDGVAFDTVRAAPDDAHVYVVESSGLEGVTAYGVTATGCRATPLGGCDESVKSTLALRDNGSGKKVARYRWGGTELPPGFDDPLDATGYSLCLYDAGAGPQPRLDASAPAGGVCLTRPCWVATSSGYRYKSGMVRPEGLAKMVLKEGVDRAKIVVGGKGETLPLAALPLTFPVTVQVQRSDSDECWETNFFTPRVNDAGRVKAKRP